jgi:1-acyl-sn-glycerol-3-phosphate acyltransferase
MTTPSKPTTPTKPRPTRIRLRARGQILPVVIVVLVTAFTLGSAGANLIPGPARPTLAEQQRDELASIVVQRRDRIAELRATGDRCQPASAHELARLLVMDGQWQSVRAYADDYELRCGGDPVVRNWGNAPRPHGH